jgi:hypothetical protein
VSRHYLNYEDDPSPSGSMQTADEAMGIFHNGGRRVNNMNRDDVTNHLTACEVYGYLNEDELAARKDAADKAKTEADLMHLVRDLPSEEKLVALRARKRLSRLRNGSKLARLFTWLLTVKTGRLVFHPVIGLFGLMLAILPAVLLAGPHGYGPGRAGVAVALGLVGGVITIVNLLVGVNWFDKNGRNG